MVLSLLNMTSPTVLCFSSLLVPTSSSKLKFVSVALCMSNRMQPITTRVGN